jgi:hypothetical protein
MRRGYDPIMRQGSAVIWVSSRMCAASYGNIMVACWREQVTPEDVRALFPVTDAMLVRYPGGLGTMSLVEQGTFATDEAREVGGRQMYDLGDRLLCTSSVLLGAGFWIAAARASTALIGLLSRRARPTRLTSSIADAAGWQAPLLGEPDGAAIDAVALEAFADELLASFRARAAG